jgi:tRNA 2-thiocytidine biosynthesis protein TtcA
MFFDLYEVIFLLKSFFILKPITVEYNICMKMKTKKNRIIRKTGKAIEDFGLIKSDDNILVALSGGKDSYTLLDTLLFLREKAPIDYTLTGITVDAGFSGFNTESIKKYCESKGVAYIHKKASIKTIIDEKLKPGTSVCAFCARLRRGVLYRFAKENGYNKIALGHHADDFIETVLMSMFYNGSLKAMSPYHISEDQNNIVIRPLVYVYEKDIIAYANAVNFPIISCSCPTEQSDAFNNTKRQRIKRLLKELEKETSDIKASILNSLSNIANDHFLTKKA